VTYSRRSSPEAKFCRCVKREKLIVEIEKVPSMESTMVGVKEIKNNQIILSVTIFWRKIAELMPGFKSFKIRAQALSPFTQTYVL
jgi:hypothetical protein